MNIALLSSGFVSWGGGLDFFKHCATALINKKQSHNLNIYLLISEENHFMVNIKNQLRPLKRILLDILSGKRPYYNKMSYIDKKIILDSFNCFKDKVNIVFYPDSKMGLIDALKKINADVIIPSIESLGQDFPFPWVGYLYDFQHKYYPEFFTNIEIVRRNRAFSKMLTDAKAVVVNALDVKKDILKYYPEAKTQIFNLPFSPIPCEEWFYEDNDTVKKYNLPEKYFVISNQFWIHKSHETAFNALAILKNKGFLDYKIVCTGNTYDPRFPNHFNELKERIAKLRLTEYIKFLGYIPKIEQIQIMRKAVGVLQPTLFEGGPGGGAVYDAIALGVPAIVSDIPVNREINEEGVYFFQAKSSDDMADKMLTLIKKDKENKLIKPDVEVLLRRGNIRLDLLGNQLLKAIEYALVNNK